MTVTQWHFVFDKVGYSVITLTLRLWEWNSLCRAILQEQLGSAGWRRKVPQGFFHQFLVNSLVGPKHSYFVG